MRRTRCSRFAWSSLAIGIEYRYRQPLTPHREQKNTLQNAFIRWQHDFAISTHEEDDIAAMAHWLNVGIAYRQRRWQAIRAVMAAIFSLASRRYHCYVMLLMVILCHLRCQCAPGRIRHFALRDLKGYNEYSPWSWPSRKRSAGLPFGCLFRCPDNARTKEEVYATR